MNRWLLIRRARGPAFLILVGITALLNSWGILSFGRSWPLYLILAGVFRLAERACLADAPVPPPYPTSPYPAPSYPAQPYPGGPAPSSLVPTNGPAAVAPSTEPESGPPAEAGTTGSWR